MHAWCSPCIQVSTLLWACCRIGVRSRFVNEQFSVTLEWRRDSRPDVASVMSVLCLLTYSLLLSGVARRDSSLAEAMAASDNVQCG